MAILADFTAARGDVFVPFVAVTHPGFLLCGIMLATREMVRTPGRFPRVTSMETETAEKITPQRRSARILLRIPLIVNVVGDNAETDWEPVETITVSQHGAMIRTKQNFRVGDTLDIRVRDKDRSTHARVAWRSTKLTPQGVELGFEILGEDGFWEITFPPDRWSRKAEPRTTDP
jgi:hypothetical protein